RPVTAAPRPRRPRRRQQPRPARGRAAGRLGGEICKGRSLESEPPMSALVQCEFELTFDDFQRSLAAHTSSLIREAKRRVAPAQMGVARVYWALMLLRFFGSPPRDWNSIGETLAYMLQVVGPLTVPVLLIGASLRLTTDAGRRNGWTKVGMACVLLAVLLAGPS